MLVRLSSVRFCYGGHRVVDGVTWQVNRSEKVGLVGPNGCGKTTLLGLIAGHLTPERGEVLRVKGCRIGFLPQDQQPAAGESLLDTLLEPFSDVLRLSRELEKLEAKLADSPDDRGLLERYGAARQQYEALAGYEVKRRVETMVHDLGFEIRDLKRPLEGFSGGELGRIALAKVLLSQPDLLLLDEPTNHLDIAATERLEARLAEWGGTVIVVSHDRYFLNKVCNRIVEVVGGNLEEFKGNFDDYQRERAQRIATLQKRIAKQKAQIEKLEDYVARNIAGQKARQAKARKRALEKIERIEVEPDPWVKAEELKVKFSIGDSVGSKEVIRAEGVGLSFGEARQLVHDFGLTVFRAERIGIVGPNGCGKSTLLRALVGLGEVQEGSVRIGREVRVGFFDQQRTDLDPERTLVEEIRKAAGEVSLEQARTILGHLRFTGDEVFRPVRTLSGGEQNRLALGKLALRPHNLLALDEPTNHLDIPARQALESALEDFPGTLLVVSHDRYFLDRLTDKTVMFTASGCAETFWGGYTEARNRIEQTRSDRSDEPRSLQSPRAPEKADRIERYRRDKERRRELERMERKLARLESTIDGLERTIKDLDQKLARSNVPWSELSEWMRERERVARRLGDAVEEWEAVGLEVHRCRVGTDADPGGENDDQRPD